MMSLSKEWALLSREMYGQEYINELSDLLQEHSVNLILECGCGDGNILRGLAEKGFYGIGIDSNPEMISFASRNSAHKNLEFKLIDWLNMPVLERKFDAVICRGNSLSAVASWGKHHIDKIGSEKKIKESIELFFRHVKTRGLIYIDCASQSEMNKQGKIEIITSNVQLKGIIEYNREIRERRVFGSGKLFGEYFSGGSASYLLTIKELEEIVKGQSPTRIWKPKLKNEKFYDILCAIK